MCDTVLLEKDLTGKVIIVTGANSGIGLATVTQLAKQKATVILCCRRTAAGDECVAAIKKDLPDATIEVMALDLADLISVKQFVQAFTAKHSRLDALVNNAGVMNCPQGKTRQGFETQIGTNHLGHFALTQQLMPLLQKSAPSRVVCLSSVASEYYQGRWAAVDLSDLMFEKRPYDGWDAYMQSKLCNVLFAKELQKRFGSSGVTSVSLHPGFVQSNLINHTMGYWTQTLMHPLMRFVMGMIKPWEGAQTSLHCILADSLEGGAYYSCGPGSPSRAVGGGYAGGWPRANRSSPSHVNQSTTK